jgi:hypothetical protein
MDHLMQRSPKEHVPVHIPQKIHSQKNRQAGYQKHTEVHLFVIASKDPSVSDIICQHQACHNADTIQRQYHQTLQS